MNSLYPSRFNQYITIATYVQYRRWHDATNKPSSILSYTFGHFVQVETMRTQEHNIREEPLHQEGVVD